MDRTADSLGRLVGDLRGPPEDLLRAPLGLDKPLLGVLPPRLAYPPHIVDHPGPSWEFTEDWLVAAEYHNIHGTGWLSPVDNPDLRPPLATAIGTYSPSCSPTDFDRICDVVFWTVKPPRERSG